MSNARSRDGSRAYLTRDTLRACLRIILGVVFVFAGVEKTADPGTFAASISGYQIVEGSAALVMGTLLPWLELLCGLGLLLGLYLRGSSLLTLVMLFGFTLAVLSALWRGLDISCGCYAWGPMAARVGWWKVGENTVLTLMCLLVFCQSGSGNRRVS
jgi:uncharacterized membrane protein YphA (DoxX/SURF4 family)